MSYAAKANQTPPANQATTPRLDASAGAKAGLRGLPMDQQIDKLTPHENKAGGGMPVGGSVGAGLGGSSATTAPKGKERISRLDGTSQVVSFNADSAPGFSGMIGEYNGVVKLSFKRGADHAARIAGADANDAAFDKAIGLVECAAKNLCWDLQRPPTKEDFQSNWIVENLKRASGHNVNVDAVFCMYDPTAINLY